MDLSEDPVRTPTTWDKMDNMTRSRILIDLAEVERLAGLGLSQEEIAVSLGICVKTLIRRKKDSAAFASAIQKGRARAAAVVSNKLFTLCGKGRLNAIIWYEKTRRGLSEKRTVIIDVSKLSDEELRAIITS